MTSFSSKKYRNIQRDTKIITHEQLFAFHKVDRQFFSRLVFILRHDCQQAMQEVAFWLWLERLNMAQYVATLIKYPDMSFEAIIKETHLCLRVAYEYKEIIKHPNIEVPMVQNMVGVHRKGVNLKFFSDNRVYFLHGVGDIIQKTCLRAFQDLIQSFYSYKYYNTQVDNNKFNQSFSSLPPRPNVYCSSSIGFIGDGRDAQISRLRQNLVTQPHSVVSSIYEQSLEDEENSVMIFNPHLKVEDFNFPLKNQYHNASNVSLLKRDGASSSNIIHTPLVNAIDYDFAMEPHPQNILRSDLINHLLTEKYKGEEQKVPPGERTIFLTFSKGYPIHEIELREFFNRSFGDIIEMLHMQEVGATEQPLYARLVVRNASAMVGLLSEHGKSTFTINGKQVWARKYVHKPNLTLK